MPQRKYPISPPVCRCSCCSLAQSCPTLCDLMDHSMTGFPVLLYLQEFAEIHLCWISDAILPSHPLSSLSPPTWIFPSIWVFSHELALCIRWPKYWSFSFSTSPSGKYSELISFRTDWFDLLAVQGTLNSLFQHHILKASVLQCSATFMVQFSHADAKDVAFHKPDLPHKSSLQPQNFSQRLSL